MLLRLEGINKTFSRIHALNNVSLTLEAGETRALVGENGAGKSTLIKIITGAYARDSGIMEVSGTPVNFRNPGEAQAAGVAAIYQEVNLLSFRTVAENIYLGREPRRWGLIDWRRLRSDTRDLLQRLGLEIDPDTTLGSLTIALRQMVAIARGVSLTAKLLVLDEPTSSLTEHEVQALYRVLDRLKAEGVAVLYVSHRFDEVYRVCDKVTILRDGKLVGTLPLPGLDRLDLVCLMLGKHRDQLRAGATQFQHNKNAAVPYAPLLQAEDLRRGRTLQDVSVAVGRGEIVGMAGLLGSGRTSTARALFGADKLDSGTVTLKGRRLRRHSIRDAISAGMGFLSEDRKAEGVVPDMSVRENLTLAALPLVSRWGIVSRRRQRDMVDHFMQRLGIKAANSAQRIRELSGGNQQKVLLARWLCRNPSFLILDEPTRGIDVGAKAEVQALVNELAESGLGVLMISSELEEIVEGCSRVIVMREGRPSELGGSDISEGAIIKAMAHTDAQDH
ncbi:MAG TPA: sugar ABC transporter ATP-binding protein [Bryobacteraceae bacterium]|nr:sugar ABC transporter ATP-binding protein [Bryobacteraceae bacterium]